MQVLCPLRRQIRLAMGRERRLRSCGRGEEGAGPMPASDSEVLVGRRYLERGFLDAAMRLFVRNPELVTATDWTSLADRLLERNRIPDAVRVCVLGGVMRLYELAGADRERWAKLVDLMTMLPDREQQAIEIVGRHLGGAPPEPPVREASTKVPRQIKAVK